MTHRGVHFLNDWIVKNVGPEDKGEALASMLATSCILVAAQQGIMITHMEEGGPSVESMIIDAMEHLQPPRIDHAR